MEEKGRGPPKGGQSSGRAGANWKPALPGADDEDSAQVYMKRFAEVDKINEMDSQMGFGAFAVGPPRMGWMINMAQTYVKDPEWPGGRSAVDHYFLQDDGEYFKTTLVASPYFFVKCKMGTENVVEDALRKRFEKVIELIERVEKEDLDFPNHLAGLKRSYLKLSFRNVSDLEKVRRALMPIAIRQGENYQDGVIPMTTEADTNQVDSGRHKKGAMGTGDPHANALSNIVDLREHDVPYALRVSIDYNICVGLWYTVRAGAGGQRAQITVVREKDVRPDPVILAYDIETSKSPLKFPDSAVDPIMMISYMINGQGFLITNRDIVSQDIEDFEYTPKPDYPGNFAVFNEPDEAALLRRFFSHIQQTRPTVMVTYNGDFFDFPYVEARALVHGMDMEAMIGFKKNNQGDYWSTHCLHLDCFRWVKRDSYLPAGSQGLKAVTSAKLGYDPLELDPELMTPLASSDPQTLANYSVSDAVATYYLYMKYVHPFIFSLCNIIPLNPDDVLRKGSGTLCETLLMAEAYRANVVMPNKHADGKENFYAGHLVESETYIGGHVEALEAGVFRADIPYKFRLDPECLQTLINDLDRALTFSLQAEGGIQDLTQVTNYDEIKAEIRGRLEMLRDNPHRNDQPLIYHLDVAAMYPNIILSNRLQPTAIVDEATCAQCDHNRPGKTCQRAMTWSWRGEVYTAKKNEYRMIKAQLESEQFPAPVNPRFPQPNGVTRMVPYHGLPEAEQKSLLHKRLAEYSQKVYRRVRKTEVVQRDSIVCQKEHAFYIDTVRAFRDRRYDYKGLHKKAKKMLDDAIAANDAIKIEECKKLVVLYDSLQLAHKCILNSFYGYVMRKGARWYSMEMAGIVCATGASIIQLARQTVERIGRPLELDTDGIWAMLPWDFPQGYTFKLANGKQHAFDYPCVMLNHQVHDMFTNDQYHTLVDPVARTYKQSSENSIFFEIDGPYRAMIIPSSTEEGKLLKKRYAVFNHNGSLAELKGFEVKRRGELKFLKVFQTQIFKVYLEGGNLAECYGKVAEVADYWLDILHGHGKALEDHDLVDLISENRSMSKSLEEYGEQKSTSISTARRLAEFLGDAMVKEKGLACKFVISAKPQGIPVAQRAIPLAIFSAEEPVKKHYLRKWLKDPGLTDFDMRSIIDWSYYLERLGSMIQKLIVIPAALQAVPNPVTRVPAPDWLLRKDKNGNGLDAKVQAKITDAFKKGANRDIEDLLKPATMKPTEPEAPDAPIIESPTAAPVALMETDYSAWIAGTKAHWRHLRESLGDRLDSAVTSTTTTSKSAFGRLAEHDKDLVTRTPWQIIGVESLEPGEFKLWVLLASSPQPRSFRLSLMRTLYFHLSCPLESLDEAESLSALLHRVYRKLPSGEDAQFLYEFSLAESTFQEHFYRFASLTQLPSLLGVYEDDVPLDLMALASLGSCAAVKADVRRHRDAQSRFALDDLAFCSTSDVPYLAKDNLQYASVLQFASDTRQLILLGLPAGRMRLLIVEPGMRRQLPSNLRSLLPADLASHENLIIETDMFPDQAAAQKSIIRSLTELVDARTGPVIVLQHSSIIAGRTATPVGLGELNLPVLTINSLPDVTNETLFPALDWQRSVGRRALAQQMALGPWLEHRLSLARYSHLPLGFLVAQEDSSVYARVADVFFARALRRAGHLLWYNHGTSEKAASLLKADSTVAHESDEAAPSQKCSGLFRTVCVEADLTGLAINAVMEHASIAAEDQAVGATIVADAGGIGLSSSSPNASLLGIVKKLLTGWLKDHVQNGQEHAQHLATGLHSWLQASSHMHSPSLARRLRSLLNRSLGLLVARLHSFGCQVVHIDSSRIVVRTTRQERAAAFALLEWIQRELKKQDAFCWIDFTPVRYWQVLLWMDAANYHGLAFTAPVDQEECQPVAEEETTWLMEWSLAEYLPPALQPIFKRLVQEFIHRATTAAPSDAEPVNRRESLIPSTEKPAEADEDDLAPGDSEFAQLFLRVLREAQKYFFSTAANPQTDCTERCFPPLVGSRLAATHGSNHPSPRAALLEFVKACGAVFALDSDHPRQAEHLMKLAHGLLGIRSFADETIWRMPAPTLLLLDIICPACTRTANLDLCRDLAVVGSKPCCRVCGHAYDPADLEAALTTQLTSLLSSYLSQDLVCKHCPPGVGLKADHMQPICLRCASPFHLATIKSDQVREHVQILKRLAPVLGMSALSCYLSNLSI